jgi:uncharacterized repeat protein (TIGR01451 family)
LKAIRFRLPAGATYVSATGSGWTCNAAAGVVSCTRVNLASGAAPDITLVASVSPTTRGTITNSTGVSGAETDPNVANETATETTTVNAQTDLALTATAAPEPVVAGTHLTYTLTAANAGPSAARSVRITENLPPTGVAYLPGSSSPSCTAVSQTITCTTSSLGPGGNTIFTVAAAIDPANRGTLSSAINLDGAEPDPNSANNSATVQSAITAQADLGLTKTDSPDPLRVNETLTYTIVVTNAGPSLATNVKVTDPLPSGVTFVSASVPHGTCAEAGGTATCDVGNLLNGSSARVTVVVTPTAAGTLNNTASATATEPDPVSANNSATAATMVNPAIPPDFSLTVLPPSLTTAPGSVATYNVSVNPTGGFNQTVALTCTTDAELSTCAVVPSSVKPDGVNPATAVVNVSVSYRAGAPPQGTWKRRLPPARLFPALRWLPLLAALLTLTSFFRRDRRVAWQRVALRLGGLALLCVLVHGCAATGSGGGGGGGAYSVRVTGTSGGTSHSVPVTLVVK